MADLESQELDQELVRRVQRGDSAAFDLLVRKYQHRIAALIGRYISDWSECQDVAQETFIRAYRAIGNFRGDALESLLPATDRIADRAFLVEGLEFADVGAGDEALGLGRADHQAPGRIQRQALYQRFEFDQYVLRERVDRLVGAIERQHHDAIGAGLGLPVAEAQTV